MVAGINGAGLGVVMDVVYNHTTASGQGDRSVLDRVVPGYYHRLNADGTVATSTCCANTATERAMMGRLVRDSILTWAKDYKVDGFRFDLMGHMPKALLLAIRADLDALTVAKDGVDGKAIILYGEGWNFGEVQDDARFVQATQANMAGTGIATFDDRVRDGVRGGGPFDDNPTVQGFGSGLYTAPNGNTANGSRSAQLTRLKVLTDNVKLGLVGEMKSYRLRDRFGSLTTGELIPYNGKAGAGYTTNPSDQVAYVDAHDNETLFDALAFKLKTTTSMADRVRMQVLAQAIPELGQGIPFFLAGSDILRSKSTDKNSYNSGDWFNVLDWSLGTNGFGRGLPPQGDNRSRLSFATAILGKPSFQPTKADMTASFNRFRDYLRIRYSSPLFRLGAGSEVKKRVSFLYGKAAAPGVITMRIVDVGRGIANLDRKARSITVVFNASATTQKVTVAALRRSHVSLHPVLRASTDRVVRRSSARRGVLTVPARTVAVFVVC
jgi:pullulanase-type alpha-1,6-glucosidase